MELVVTRWAGIRRHGVLAWGRVEGVFQKSTSCENRPCLLEERSRNMGYRIRNRHHGTDGNISFLPLGLINEVPLGVQRWAALVVLDVVGLRAFVDWRLLGLLLPIAETRLG